MDQDQTTLSRALVALPGFEWEAGMLTQHGERVCRVLKSGMLEMDELEGRCHGEHTECLERLLVVRADDGGPRVPDLNDKGNGSILLDALGPGWNAIMARPGSWHVDLFGGSIEQGFSGPTLAHACALALVARGYYRK